MHAFCLVHQFSVWLLASTSPAHSGHSVISTVTISKPYWTGHTYKNKCVADRNANQEKGDITFLRERSLCRDAL